MINYSKYGHYLRFIIGLFFKRCGLTTRNCWLFLLKVLIFIYMIKLDQSRGKFAIKLISRTYAVFNFLVVTLLLMGCGNSSFILSGLGIDETSENIIVATYVSIEDASGGSGSAITTETIISGSTLNLYAVSRDSLDNFVADLSVNWSVPDGLGSFSSAFGSSTVFTAQAVGTQLITAEIPAFQSSSPGNITVSTEYISVPQNMSGYTSLANNFVNSVFIDYMDGTIYAATAGGLSISRDLGISFLNITTAQGLGDNYVYNVFVDSVGTIYASTMSGLSVSTNSGASFRNITTDDGVSFSNKTTTDGLGDNGVSGVYVDSSGTIYASTASTGTFYDPEDGGLSISTDAGVSFININTTLGLGNKSLSGVYVDPGFIIYAATDSGLSISDNSGVSFSTKTTADGLGDNMVKGVFIDGQHILYVATIGGLSVSTDSGVSFLNKTIADGLGSNWGNGVFVDSIGRVYAATNGGLSISFNGGVDFTNSTTVQGLGNNVVRGVSVGADGTIYAATSGGLSISTDEGVSFTNFTKVNGLVSESLYGVYILNLAPINYIYVATSSGLSISTDGGASFSNKTMADGLVGNFVRGVYAESSGALGGINLYVATSEGLSISTDGGVSFSNKTITNGLGHNYLTGVSLDSNGSIYLSSTGGLFSNLSREGGVP